MMDNELAARIVADALNPAYATDLEYDLCRTTITFEAEHDSGDPKKVLGMIAKVQCYDITMRVPCERIRSQGDLVELFKEVAGRIRYFR